MDTSNSSTPVINPERRLEYVLGKQPACVPSTELTPEEWLAIIREVLLECLPFIRYFPRYETIRSLNNYSHGYDRFETDEKLVEYLSGLDEDTRCFGLARLDFPLIDGDPVCGIQRRFCPQSVTPIVNNRILLSYGGQLLLMEFAFTRHTESGHGFRGHKTATVEQCRFARFSALNNTRLQSLFELFPRLGRELLEAITELVSVGVSDRKAWLKNMISVSDRLGAIRSRISI